MIKKLQQAGTLLFVNQKEIENSVSSLCDKFILHGLFVPAEHLKKLSNKLLNEHISKPELQNRLNVLKFLICMSHRPTTHCINYQPPPDLEEEEIVDWGAYLNEGIERWKPPVNDISVSLLGFVCEMFIRVIVFRILLQTMIAARRVIRRP